MTRLTGAWLAGAALLALSACAPAIVPKAEGDGAVKRPNLFVAETASDTFAEVDYPSGIVLRRLGVGEGGDGMAILP